MSNNNGHAKIMTVIRLIAVPVVGNLKSDSRAVVDFYVFPCLLKEYRMGLEMYKIGWSGEF